MHPETISSETKKALDKLSKSDILGNFYLAGGTALAIQLGHRESIDLDWFIKDDFSARRMRDVLAGIGELTVTGMDEEGTLNGVLDGVKISFFKYGYGQIFPLVDFEGVKLADERDIAAMKIDAISSRGSKKDFIDLYFLLGKYHLVEIIGFFEKKFSNANYNKLHILKSLEYFDSAEKEPMPIMFKKVEWLEAKRRIESEVDDYIKKYGE